MLSRLGALLVLTSALACSPPAPASHRHATSSETPAVSPPVEEPTAPPEAAEPPSPPAPALARLGPGEALQIPGAPSADAPSRLAVGPATSAAIVGGRVYVWGDHPEHRPYRNEGPGPIVLPEISDAVQLAIFGATVIVLRANGSVVEWSEEEGRVSVRVPPMQTIAARGDQSCGVARTGQVHCWRGGERNGPERIDGLTNARAVVMRGSIVCALLADGTVRCAGEGGNVDFGTGEEDEEWGTRVASPRGLDGVVQLAATAWTTCALRRDGTVHCWGVRLGGSGDDLAPTEISDLDGVVSIAAGSSTMCARRRDGSVACWGTGIPGLPTADIAPELPRPVEAVSARGATELVIGNDHACWTDAAGAIRCIGSNVVGEVGTLPRRTVVLEIPGVRAAWVSASDARVWAGGPEGAWTWGGGDTVAELRPRRIFLPNPGDVRGTALLANCVLRNNGHVQCYENLDAPNPTVTHDIEGVAALDGPCVRMTNGAVRCVFGTVEVPGGPFRALATRQNQACAVATASSRLSCWRVAVNDGVGAIEELRDIADVAGADEISAGIPPCARFGATVRCFGRSGAYEKPGRYDEIGAGNITCGRAGGAVSCWGYTDMAELMAISGEGHPDARRDASPVEGLTDATAIAVGSGHGCALRPGGRVACWSEVRGFAVGEVPRWIHMEPVLVSLPGTR
jgi:hypothetical protein